MNAPSVSIGMPVYNDSKFLSKALDSLLSQTYGDFELIISDDASFDGSEQICRTYAEKDKRIKYIRHSQNMGISANMIFLLKEARSKYFMWAANDDLWDKDFIRLLVQAHEEQPNCIVAFSPVQFIDEEEKPIEEYGIRASDYQGNKPESRLRKLVKTFDDSFGYGLFKRSSILDVQFPTWWWVNKKCAYNNIYPSLCFYLSKGDFVLVRSRPLWFNRLKKEENVNHKVPFNLSLLRGWLAFTLRRFNLVYVSLVQVYRGTKNASTSLKLAPLMFYKWFLHPSFQELSGRIKLYRARKINFL